MTAAELLAQLLARQVRLSVDGRDLRVNAPPGALTPELKAALLERKAELVDALAAVRTATQPAVRQIPRTRRLPLSFAQERLWFLAQLDPASPVYHIPAAFRLSGALDVAALRQALEDIVRRHEVLRTNFEAEQGIPVQRIHAPDGNRLDFQVVNGRQLGPALDQRLAAEAAQPFNLSADPLLRVRLFPLSPADHVLLFVVHHVVFDGWSFEIFLRELSARYATWLDGRAKAPELPLQYADFAVWQREWLQGTELERQLAYWREQLGGDAPPLELPTDHPRPRMQTYQGGRERFTIPAQALTRLTEMGRAEGATLFMTLLAAFRALLYRYTEQEDISVGTDVAARGREEIEPLIGYFANTLVLRNRLDGSLTLRELVRREREVCLGAFSHQDLPFVTLVEDLQPVRDPGRTPLVQTMFALQDSASAGWQLGSLASVPMDIRLDVARTDLSFFLYGGRAGVEAAVEYSSDLFDRETITRLISHYQAILNEMVERPDARVEDIPLLSEDQRRKVVFEWNWTERPFPSDATIHQLIAEQAKRTPEAVALVWEQGALTYADLEAQASRLAQRLSAVGVARGHLVGLCTDRSGAMVVGALGILKTGAAYVPLDPAFPADRLKFMAEDAQLTLVVTQTAWRDRLSGGSLRLWYLDDSETRGPADAVDASTWGGGGAEDLVYLMYTSGSTGTPKGVEVTHQALVNCLWALRDRPGMQATDVVLAVSTLSFDIATVELFLPLLVGARVVLASREAMASVTALRRLLDQHGVTVMQGTPATWRMLLDGGWEGRRGFRVLCGGETLSPDLATELLDRADQVWNLYGPTEATVWATVKEVRRESPRITLGRPLANMRAYVLDRKRRPVPVGLPGELYLGGTGVARGYRRRPALTSERFVPDPFSGQAGARLYRTGDMARLLPDGEIEFLGRRDQQVKLRGFRIELGEIEAALLSCPGVSQAAADVRQDRRGDRRLVAYLVYQPGQHRTGSDVRQHLRRTLPDYMVPQHVVEVAALPLTPNGKLDRRALPDPMGGGRVDASDFTAPCTPMERLVAEIWREVLDIEQVSIYENFFDAGGHSLLSIRALYLIHQRTGQHLDPRVMLFDTLAQIAARLSAMDAGEPGLISQTTGATLG